MNDPLTPDEITSNSVSTIVVAHRNARVLHWLKSQDPITQTALRRLYACELGFPVDETVWFPEPMDNESLEWVYQKRHTQIDQ